MKKTVRDIDIKGKRVIMRVDFNVPLDESGNITDSTRIDKAIPTINYILEQGASLILMSHLGRPKGEVKSEFSLKPCADYLEKALSNKVIFTSDCVGSEVASVAKSLNAGEVLMLENLRFHKEEEKNDENFAKELASLADVYVNDAFGTAHRAHASTEGIARVLPGVSGFLLEKEIQFLGDTVDKPDHPFVAIIGGAKVSSKIGVLEHLIGKVDTLVVGGGMAYTFFKAKGYEIGTSLCEEDYLDTAKKVMADAEAKGTTLLLPVDNVVSLEFSNDSEFKTVPSNALPEGWMGMDIGPNTIEKIKEALSGAKTVIWNGPLGVFEMENFSKGTFAVAKCVADTDCVSIIGGGDSVSAVNKSGLADKMTHISTGGGASLEYLEGKELPGVAILQDK